MDVSIIIVNYNTSSLISDCLESICRRTKGIFYEIIVVDNNTEDLNEAIKNPGMEDLKFIQLPENVGFGRANNEGLKIAKGRNILFLNPDTIIINNAIKILSDYLDTHRNCGACGGNLYDSDLKPTGSHGQKYPSTSGYFSFLIPKVFTRTENESFNYSDKAIKVAYICGADLMIPRNILDRLGGFDPGFFMYFEEIELCFRISKSGFQIVNIPTAHIQHLEGKSGNVSDRKACQHFESSTLFFKKRYGKIGFRVNRIMMPMIINLHIAMAKIMNNGSKLHYWRIWKRMSKSAR